MDNHELVKQIRYSIYKNCKKRYVYKIYNDEIKNNNQIYMKKSSSESESIDNIIESNVNNKTISKIAILKRIMKCSQENSKLFKKRYKKTKRIDDVLDVTNSILSGTSISLIIVGFTYKKTGLLIFFLLLLCFLLKLF